MSIYVRQRGLVRPELFSLGDGTIALRDSFALLLLACWGNLGTKDTSVLIHPRQRKGQESWKRWCAERIINSGASGEDTADVHRRPETKVLVQGTRQIKDWLRRAYSIHIV